MKEFIHVICIEQCLAQSRCLINASYSYSVRHHLVCQQERQNAGELIPQVLYIIFLMRKSSTFTLWLWNVCVLAKTRKKILKWRWEERGFHIRRKNRLGSGLEKWRLRCTMMNFMKDRNSMNSILFMKYWKIRTGVKDEYLRWILEQMVLDCACTVSRSVMELTQ